MEQEKVNGNKEPSAEASSYRWSACHGDEDWGPGHPLRGRTKSRSLSAAPVLASAREFRYWPSGPVGVLRRQEGVVLAGMASQRALPANPPALMPILTVEAEVWGCRPVWPQALGTQ